MAINYDIRPLAASYLQRFAAQILLGVTPMTEKKPSVFSIALADSVALGHINAGINLYRAFEALPKEERKPGEQLDFGRTIQLAVPAVTNFALGVELLLKVHHFQLTGKYPKGHDIGQLGNDFPADGLCNLCSVNSVTFRQPVNR